ncbi:MAG: hypothetical protein K0S74_1646 [Chlamydiales bacterium]|jgi:uncharacterized metal-binding protein YceD (DUF177 family)|nr:hypothetical protein [Chlamydiales bacterium]
MSLIDPDFLIYTDRLANEGALKFDFTTSPSFIQMEERELCFRNPVAIYGSAYLAGEELIIQLTARTEAIIPCNICNQEVTTPIILKDFYHVVPIAEIPEKCFDFSSIVREEILLQAPFFAECNNGNCSLRKELSQYLTSSISKDKTSGPTHQPFANLEFPFEADKS